MTWTRVFSLGDLPSGSMATVNVANRTVLLANVEGTVYAMDGVCSHQGGALGQGKLEGYEVRCPRHGARYDVRSGAVVANVRIPLIGKASALHSYAVRVEGEDVLVEV